MPSPTHVRREPARKSRRSRSVRLSVRPDGSIYGYVVEQVSSRPRKERVVCWLGKSPSLSRIRSAAKMFSARLPNQFKETL